MPDASTDDGAPFARMLRSVRGPTRAAKWFSWPSGQCAAPRCVRRGGGRESRPTAARECATMPSAGWTQPARPSVAGSYIIPELIAAGHEVTGLARSDPAATALSALGATVRRGDLEDLDGLKEAAADSDGVIHVAHRQDLLPTGGIDAVAAAEVRIMLAYGESLAGTGKPLVAAGSIGSPGNLSRSATEEDPALPSGEEHTGTLRARNIVETSACAPPARKGCGTWRSPCWKNYGTRPRRPST